MARLEFKNWKQGRMILIRDDKGRIITRRLQKGSGIKTKAQALKLFKDQGTLAKNTVTLSKRKPSIKPKKGERTVIKTPKGTVTFKDNITNVELIGKNTALIRSPKPLKNQKHFQYKCTVFWGKKRLKTVGYSELDGKFSKKNKNFPNQKRTKASPKQAFNRCLAAAISNTKLKYDWVIQILSDDRGIATAPNGKETIEFTMLQEVVTYVQTAKNP